MVLFVKIYMGSERSGCSNYLDCKHPYREYEIRGCDHQCYGDQKERCVVAIIFGMYQRYQVTFRIMDVMIMDVISEQYPAEPPMAEAIVHQGLGERNQ